MKHLIPSEFRRKQVAIDLVGCGGTGSRLLPMLADLDLSLKQFGMPGLYLAVIDPDVVTEPSVGRTLFTASDIGQYKATVATDRVNFAYGTLYRGLPARYAYPLWNAERFGEAPDIVITCTDSLRSRVEIFDGMMSSGRRPPRYWLDCGNDADHGQVILGEIDGHMGRNIPPLPTVMDVFSDMRERAEGEEEEPESCTLADALSRQGLFINRRVALEAAELLWRLFRDGGLNHHGIFFNGMSGRSNPLPIGDPGSLPPLPNDVLRNSVTPAVARPRRRLRSRERGKVSAIPRSPKRRAA
jgi:PRTRC genetic system ThiF family protein